MAAVKIAPRSEAIERNLRRMIRVATPFTVEPVARFRESCGGEFVNLAFYSEEEHEAIIDWLTAPSDDFRVHLAYAGETKTRVRVARVEVAIA